MRSETETRSQLLRFLDSFFQERNIKWMLVVGTMILFGSSMMLVTSRWASYAPVSKNLILLGYTAAVFAAAQISYWQLALRRTGTVLMSLTLLLVPINFLALHHIRTPLALDPLEILAQTALLAVTGIGGWLAARRIFGHFLRGNQPTFTACYLTLCLAGAVVADLPLTWWPGVVLFLWATFAIGTVKVNRHIFWLIEEHRLPRIFGFFPIALLGTQFLTLLYVTCLSAHIPFEWMGLAAVLVAVPVLLTADTVARVFQERTGNLVRPLPWSIVAPLLVGLGLCAGGVCMATSGMPRPYALVPTAALAACMMAVIARRTGQAGFVWAMLAGTVVAYNFSPVFFQSLARAAVHHGAMAVHEPRLPYAFYGLTYLPLLIVATFGSFLAAKRGSDLFARPLRHFAVGVPCLLLAVAFSHPKAVFPVGAAMVAVFALQTMLFRDRRLILASIIAFIAAAFGFTTFAAEVLGFPLAAGMHLICLGMAAAVLLFPGWLIDRWSARWITTSKNPAGSLSLEPSAAMCQGASLVLALLTSCVWISHYGVMQLDHGVVSTVSGALLSALLVTHTVRWLARGLGEIALCFTVLTGLVHLAANGAQAATMISAGTLALLAFWVLARVLQSAPKQRISEAFVVPLLNVSLAGLSGAMVYYVAVLAAATMGRGEPVSYLCSLLTVAWAFDAAHRTGEPVLAAAACFGLLGVVSQLLATSIGIPEAWNWLPVAWNATAVAAIPIAARGRTSVTQLTSLPALSPAQTSRLAADRAVLSPVRAISLAILGITAVASLAVFTPPLRIAGLIAVAGLVLFARSHDSSALRRVALYLLNWQFLAVLMQVFAPDLTSVAQLSWPILASCWLPVSLCAGLSLLASQLESPGDKDAGGGDEGDLEAAFAPMHRAMLRLLVCSSMIASLQFMTFGLNVVQVAVAAIAFGAIIASELLAACQTQDERRVWLAEIALAAAAGYFAMFGVIAFASGWSMFILVGGAFLAWALGQLSGRGRFTAVLRTPLIQTAMVLPLAAVFVGVARHLLVAPGVWLGLNSLALLLAAGFYFWRGIEQAQKWLLVLSAVIVNVALTLLWRDLEWSDPQFFMMPLGISILALVQLLKEEIPVSQHAPLRYLGALTILVSPTFHIVSGSWIHLWTLMAASVGVTLLAIGLRVRALMYTGTAFLVADLIAMVVRGSIDRPSLLWAAGIALGGAVLALAAFCERHRESLLQRLRYLACELEAWE